MELGHAFDMWRDYLGLAATVAALRHDDHAAQETPLSAPGSAPATSDPGPVPATSDPSSALGMLDPSLALVTSDPSSVPATSDAGPAPASPCGFCKHNGEARAVYGGHSLRDAAGRVLCPVLRSYVCPQCGATQERAHTRRFCPLTRRGYTSVYSRSAGASRAKK